MELTTAQTDRACGVLLASAAGDALGAGYEFTTRTSAEGTRVGNVNAAQLGAARDM